MKKFLSLLSTITILLSCGYGFNAHSATVSWTWDSARVCSASPSITPTGETTPVSPIDDSVRIGIYQWRRNYSVDGNGNIVQQLNDDLNTVQDPWSETLPDYVFLTRNCAQLYPNGPGTAYVVMGYIVRFFKFNICCPGEYFAGGEPAAIFQIRKSAMGYPITHPFEILCPYMICAVFDKLVWWIPYTQGSSSGWTVSSLGEYMSSADAGNVARYIPGGGGGTVGL